MALVHDILFLCALQVCHVSSKYLSLTVFKLLSVINFSLTIPIRTVAGQRSSPD